MIRANTIDELLKGLQIEYEISAAIRTGTTFADNVCRCLLDTSVISDIKRKDSSMNKIFQCYLNGKILLFSSVLLKNELPSSTNYNGEISFSNLEEYFCRIDLAEIIAIIDTKTIENPNGIFELILDMEQSSITKFQAELKEITKIMFPAVERLTRNQYIDTQHAFWYMMYKMIDWFDFFVTSNTKDFIRFGKKNQNSNYKRIMLEKLNIDVITPEELYSLIFSV